jgi:hypothetical protein
MLLEWKSGTEFPSGEKEVRLKPLSGTSSLNPEEEERLRQKKSQSGNTLFVLPYVNLNTDENEQARINNMVQMYLFAGIQMHLQELRRKNVKVPIERFSLDNLEGEVDIYNTDRVLTYGRYLNALGVAGGWASLGQADDDNTGLMLNSSYIIIPSVEGFEGNDLLWEDHFPAGILNPRQIAELLNRQWGRKTVIAIALSAFNRALDEETDKRKERLEEISNFLKAELEDAGADEPLVQELEALRTLIEQAMSEGRNP